MKSNKSNIEVDTGFASKESMMFKVGTQVRLTRFVAPNGLTGAVYTVNSATNTGTKRNPVWRYYLGGVGYVDADAIEAI